MAAIASLRYFLLIRFHLRKIASPDQFRKLVLRQRKDVFRCLPELVLLMVVNVRPLTFGEPIREECLLAATEPDDGPVAFRSSLSGPGDPLFDELAAKVGVDLAFFGPGKKPIF